MRPGTVIELEPGDRPENFEVNQSGTFRQLTESDLEVVRLREQLSDTARRLNALAMGALDFLPQQKKALYDLSRACNESVLRSQSRRTNVQST